jgi:hypothetical protein
MRARAAMRKASRFYRAHWLRVVLVAAVIYTGFSFITALLILQLDAYGLFFAIPLWLTGVFWVQAGLAPIVEDARSGRPKPSLQDVVNRAGKRVNRISVAGILAAVPIYLGFYLIVPGLILLTRWSLLVPVIMFENAGVFTAFARSRDLVRDNAWRVLGFIVGSVALFIGSLLAIGFVSGALAGDLAGFGGWLVLGAISIAVLSLTTPFIALVWTMSYLELRAERPPQEEELARLRPSRALDEGWATYAVHPGRLFALGAIVTVPVMLVEAAVLWSEAAAFVPLLAAPLLVGYLWLAGLLAAGLRDFPEGTAALWLRRVWRRTAPRAGPFVIVGVLAGLVFATGIGILLLIWWTSVGAAVVVEGLGVRAALGRSRHLASYGGPRQVLKLLIISIVVAGAVSILVLLFFPALPDPWPLLLIGGANVLIGPYVALAWANAYWQLRSLEEATLPGAPERSSRMEALTR